jgi:hypothetical protein
MTKKRALIICLVTIISWSCGPNQRILNSATENNRNDPATTAVSTGNVAPVVTTFEQDLNAMRNADFKFIIAFRRKDGQPLDAADRSLIGKAGSGANRRRLSDGGRAVIIGSNFQFTAWEFNDLTERFTMENYSKPDSGSLYSNATPPTHGINERRER